MKEYGLFQVETTCGHTLESKWGGGGGSGEVGVVGLWQGAKKVIFKACHSGDLKLAYTSPNIISTSPQNILMGRIDFTVLL